MVVALLILFYDLPLPDELKGFTFFVQVIGLIYRNAPYLVGQSSSVSLSVLSLCYLYVVVSCKPENYVFYC